MRKAQENAGYNRISRVGKVLQAIMHRQCAQLRRSLFGIEA